MSAEGKSQKIKWLPLESNPDVSLHLARIFSDSCSKIKISTLTEMNTQ